jgi:ParB family chromosome partitioning protein
MSGRKRGGELQGLLRQMLTDEAVSEACRGVSAKLSSEFGNVPRGTLLDLPFDVPRGTFEKSLAERNVPRGTLTDSPPAKPWKGVHMSTPQQPISKNKPRLGRGLSSLISVSELPVEAEVKAPTPSATPAAPPPDVRNEANSQPSPSASVTQVVSGAPLEIPVEQIAPNPHQPRRQMNETLLAELAASLKSSGLIQPIVVRKAAEGYQLIAGERRLRAAKLAGMKLIPAIIRDVDSFTQAQMALVENIQREELNPIDRALAYRALATQLGLTHQELAIRLGEDRSSITNYVRLLDLAEPVRELVRSRMLSMGHAKLLAGVSDPAEQQRLAELCVAQDLSVRNLERLVTQPGVPPEPANQKGPSISAHLLDLEKTIARQLGMRVQVRSTSKKGKGRLTIHYASLDQFDDLIQRLGITIE